MLCRTRNDCSWLSEGLSCQRAVHSRTEDWFGEEHSSIFGKCQCRVEMEWNENLLECQKLGMCDNAIAGIVIGGILGVIVVIGVLVGLCWCVCPGCMNEILYKCGL